MQKTLLTVWPVAHVVLCFLFVLPIITGSAVPVSVVLSDSMQPEIHKGDLLFAVGVGTSPFMVGDIVLYQLPHRQDSIPIVHRIVKVMDQDHVLTQGDNNPVDDRGLYEPSFETLPRSAILGRVRGHLPWIGWPSLLFQSSKFLQAVILIGAFLMELRDRGSASDRLPGSKKEWFAFLLYPHSDTFRRLLACE